MVDDVVGENRVSSHLWITVVMVVAAAGWWAVVGGRGISSSVVWLCYSFRGRMGTYSAAAGEVGVYDEGLNSCRKGI